MTRKWHLDTPLNKPLCHTQHGAYRAVRGLHLRTRRHHNVTCKHCLRLMTLRRTP